MACQAVVDVEMNERNINHPALPWMVQKQNNAILEIVLDDFSDYFRGQANNL